MAPMLRALLVDRFKMTYHTEERPVSTYSLVSAKPKMKKADPASRTSCKNAPAPPGRRQVRSCSRAVTSPWRSLRIVCRVWRRSLVGRLWMPRRIEGGWDFSLTYSRNAGMIFGGGRGGDAGSAEGSMPAATEPSGVLNIFEAMEKQLGLKLEMHKRPMPVIVIDHLEQKPTEN